MPQRLLLLVLLCCAVATLAFMARHDAAAAGAFVRGDFSPITYKIALFVFVTGTALMLFRERLAQALTAALLWVGIGLVLVVGYSYRFELHAMADRVIAEFAPGHVVSHGRTVAVTRANGGDFAVIAQINGARIPMVLDTGASSVVLTHEDAKAAGLPLEVLEYSVSIDTANGRTHAAPVRLDRLAVGSLVERSVDALVAQPGQLKTSLLGMSFLNRLQSWQVTGDRLLLRGYP